jgi:HEAT repeat protein
MVFGLFSKEKALQKTIEKATNKLAQQPDRWSALEKLKEDGSEDALVGLCRRFSVTSMKGVEDEQEKHWVVDSLVEKGPAALAPVVRYMKTAEQLAFPLRVLERVADRDKVLEVADELFASEPPGYVRMPERRIDLLRWFSEWKPATDDEVVTRFTPYVTDFDENVRFAAIDGMGHRDPAKIAPPLIKALLRPEEESGRIKRTVCEVLEKAKSPLGDQAAAVTAALTGPLGDSFKVEGGVLKKR